MMICLTGDVHHRSLSTLEAPLIDPLLEAQLAVTYAEIAATHGLKVTLFITGRVAIEHGAELQRLAAMTNVEIGGHGYTAFNPLWLHRLFFTVWRSHWGPAWYQQGDIRRTVASIREVTGPYIVSWRNHSFIHDQHTPRLLRMAGIRVWSDIRDLKAKGPESLPCGLVVLPINTPVDHDHIPHGYKDFRADHQRRWYRKAQKAQGLVMSGEEWVEQIMGQANQLASTPRSVVTILAHPVCMYLLDSFRTFDHLCVALSRYSSMFARECAGG